MPATPPHKLQPAERAEANSREEVRAKAAVSANGVRGEGGVENAKGKAAATTNGERGEGAPEVAEQCARNRVPGACSPNGMALPAAEASALASGVLFSGRRDCLKSARGGGNGGVGVGVGGSANAYDGKQVNRNEVVGVCNINEKRSSSSGGGSGCSSGSKLLLREGCGSELVVGRHCVGAKRKLEAQRDGGNMEYTSA